MKVYLAAQYSRKHEIEAYARELERAGIHVVASWLAEPHSPDTKMSDVSEDILRHYAETDLRDIDRSDVFVFFSEDPLIPIVRGGRHVELGYALGHHIEILLVGPYENIFHYLLHLNKVDTWTQAKVYLTARNQRQRPVTVAE